MYIVSNNKEIEKQILSDKIFLIVGLVFFLSALAVSIAFIIYLCIPISDTVYSLGAAHIIVWLINVVVGTIFIFNTKKGSNARIMAKTNIIVGVIFTVIGIICHIIMFIVL